MIDHLLELDMNQLWTQQSAIFLVLIVVRLTLLFTVAWGFHALLRGRNPWLSILLWRITVLGAFTILFVSPYLPAWGPALGRPVQQVENAVSNLLIEPVSKPNAPPAKQRFVRKPESAAELPLNLIKPRLTASVPAVQPLKYHNLITPSMIVSRLIMLYGIVVAAFVGQLVLQVILVRAIVRRAAAAEPELVKQIARIAESLGLKQPIAVRVSSEMAGPFVTGITRPVLILPSNFLNRFSDAEQKFVIAHECGHILGRDLFWVLAARFMRIILWPHPLSWRIPSAHRLACDVRCDAIASGNDSLGYSKMLARVALASHPYSPPVALAFLGQSETVRRIKMIDIGLAKFRLSRSRELITTVVLLGLVCLVGTVGMTSMRISLFANEYNSPKKKVQVTVVDEKNQPIRDVEVQIDGLRTKKERASHHGNPFMQKSRTDENGVAVVEYPQYVLEKMETGDITISTSHPDFIPSRQDYPVETSVRIQLHPGRKVSFQARDAATQKPLTSGVFAVAGGGSFEAWKMREDGSLLSPALKPEVRTVLLFALSKDQPILFSDAIDLNKYPSQQNTEASIPLSVGTRIQGRLSNNVPRPIKNGKVGLHVETSFSDWRNYEDQLCWLDYVDVQPDGTFEFTSVPRNQSVELLATCDGWVSTTPAATEILQRFPRFDSLQHCEGLHDVRVVSQQFSKDKFEAIEIPMEQTATCEFVIVDDDGQPIQDVQVYLSPNDLWSSGGRLVGEFFRTRDSFGLTDEEIAARREKWKENWKTSPYVKMTDREGRCTMRQLPGKRGQNIYVQHADYELPPFESTPFHRFERVDLTPGDTYEVELRLQKKGNQVLGE